MVHQLEEGIYAITSVSSKTSVGRKPFEPLDLTPKPIYTLERGFQTPFWVVEKAEGGGYILHAAGDPTGIYNKHVYAFLTHAERAEHWQITEQPHQGKNLYIIQTKDRRDGWVASGNEEENAPVVVGPLPATKSLPPQYLPPALFHFVRIDRQETAEAGAAA